ncbi:Tannase domain containing protein [Pyrenophora tritici-repentis]|nr:Tannase domain containing protein [Pyrenophora tritici-repentis]
MCAIKRMLVIWLLALLHVTVASPSFEQKCLAFRRDNRTIGAKLNVLQYVAAGTNLTFPDNDASCARASQKVSVDLCRITLEIKTSRISNISFEAWFPENWSGRFLATGNGGIDGCIKYEDLAYGALNGFATVGANNGHNGTGGAAFLNNPQMVVDFAYRSLHKTVETGKALSQQFYQSNYTKSYYLGCSLGGRQGVSSAEKFPKDFDGIVAGAPGVDFNSLYAWRAHFFSITGPKASPNFIPATAWRGWIHDEVLRQCDTIDKVKDGIIEDPSLCNFDPSTLLCDRNKTSQCLNQQQVQQLQTIFSPYTYENGDLIYPAMQPGSEIHAVDRLYDGTPFGPSNDWFKYVVYNEPSWNASTFDLDDVRAAQTLNPGDIRTFPSSLSGFRDRGAKLLMYHGQQDNQISSFNTPRFYEHLRGNASYAAMDEWVRFFRISGMFHCSTGPGAWVLGQGGEASQAGIAFDPQHNVLSAMVNWVEKGVAPEYIEGTKFVNDTVSGGVDFTKRHCKYPARNVFIGGDDKLPGSWECQVPNTTVASKTMTTITSGGALLSAGWSLLSFNFSLVCLSTLLVFT